MALSLLVPEVKYLGGAKAIFSQDTRMVQSQNKVGVFMSPTFKRFIKTIHTLKILTEQAHIAAAYAFPREIALQAISTIWKTQQVGPFIGVAL